METNQHDLFVSPTSVGYGRVRFVSPLRQGEGLQHQSRAGSLTRDLKERNQGGGKDRYIGSEFSPLLVPQLDALPSDSVPSSEVPDPSQLPPSPVPPHFLLWIGPALICALAYALYNIFIKKGSATLHPVLGGVVLQIVAAVVGGVLLCFLVWKDGMDGMNYDMKGIQWAVWAGVSVGSAEILSFFVSGMGVQAMQSIPIIIGGSVLFGTVLGYVLLGEMLTLTGWLGVAMIAAGIALVGIDPGGAASTVD